MRYPSALCLLTAVVALSVLGACDRDDFTAPAPALRSDWLDDGTEPTPGGGTCEECVVEAALSITKSNVRTLDLCIDTQIVYTGSERTIADDRPFIDLLEDEDGAWSLELADSPGTSQTHCSEAPWNSPGCTIVSAVQVSVTRAHVKIQFSPPADAAPYAPNILQFVRLPGLQPIGHTALPAMRIPLADGDGFQCGSDKAKGKAGVTGAEPLTGGEDSKSIPLDTVAHVTLPGAYGGVRSCSGVLVGPQHVLTARHCIMSDDPDTPGYVDPADLEIHLRNQTDPHSVMSAHSIVVPDGDLDLALVRLATPTNGTPALPIELTSSKEPQNSVLVGAGVGVAGRLSDGYDWGHVRSVELRPHVPNKALELLTAETIGSEDVRFYENTMEDGRELCRGDSGGPVFRVTDGQAELVGITFARAFTEAPHTTGTPMLEDMSSAFAFSAGNLCGQGQRLAYLMHAFDYDTWAWIDAAVAGVDE